MKVDFSVPLRAYTGQALTDADGALTLRAIACNAITAVLPGVTLTGLQKLDRVSLAGRIHAGPDPVTVTVEEVALLKQTIDALYLSPVIVAAAWGALDPEPAAG